MDKRRSKAARPKGGGAAHKASSILGEIPVPNGTGAIQAEDAPADVDDDFADLMDIDFSQYIADKDDNAGSMNSPSSPSVGMMSKTPFKTPVPSEYADDPIEADSSPARKPIRLRDYLPGIGSSVEPSFAMDDSQQTKVIPKGAPVNGVPLNPPPRFSYSLSVSPDNAADAPTNTKAGQPANINVSSPVAEVVAPAKRKKSSQGQKAVPPKRSTRNRKVNGKKKPQAKHDDVPAARRAKEATPLEEIEPAETLAKEASPVKEATPAEATPSRRPLLARMLSVLSEPGSLKWEEPLVGGQQSPVDSDGRSPAHSPSSPGGTPAVEDITMQPVDDDGSIYEPSIPASFAEPFGLSEPLEREGVHDAPPVVPKKNQTSPSLRLDLDVTDPSPPRGSPSKSPVKGARKKPSPKKTGPATQKAPAPSKRRRVQEPVKKRVVQPRAKAKSAHTREDLDGAMVIPPAEPEITAIPDTLHINSKTQISETGSPAKIRLPSESASPGEGGTNKMTNSPGSPGNEGAVDSTNLNVPGTKAPEVEVVFQSQPSRPRGRAGQVDSPQSRGEKVGGTAPKKNSSALITPKSMSKPSGAGAKNSAEKNSPTDAPNHVQLDAPAQKPGFEAFRQHILGQLTTIETRQKHDQPSESGSPDGSGVTPDGRVPMSTVPQHMLGRVLHTVTEKTLEYVKAKEKDLDSIAQEYQSGVTAFIDRVEKLHEVENSGAIKALNKERQSFIESCKDGAKTCEGFMVKLEQCSLSGRGPGGLEKWLQQGEEMKKGLQVAELGGG